MTDTIQASPSGLISINLTKQLKEINSALPKSVTAKLAVSGNTVFIQYSVRYESGGKKHSVGTFLTKSGAVRALVEHKVTGAIATNADEALARSELAMDSIGVKIGNEAVKAVAAPVHAMSNEFIAELLELKGILHWQVFGEENIEVMKSDILYTITPAEQSAWLVWYHGQREGS
jgi:hypothetical protein